jgi:FMN phosphatase YigB (HAD superfamily)
MISEPTLEQLARLNLNRNLPLLICDVDEVVVHFTRDFENFLATRGLWLEATSLALNGNIKKIGTNTTIAQESVGELVDEFFWERTRHLQPIDGAVEALQGFGQDVNVVMLTNLPHFARADRIANLLDLGLAYPVITNSGPKGPAIKNLAARSDGPVVFVDDSPHFIASAYEHASHVHLIHFLQDDRFAVHTPHFDFVSLRTGVWETAKPHIENLLKV